MISRKNDEKPGWFADPESSHFVQFYSTDDELVSSMYEYISSGIANDETCIVIASKSHLKSLGKYCKANGLDLASDVVNHRYIEFDATQTLNMFMNAKKPDHEVFIKTIGNAMQLAAGRGRPIRAFGEMVSILWQEGNERAMIQLEEYWNRLGETSKFLLYCAYPQTLFNDKDINHRSAIEDIVNIHSDALGLAS